MLLPLPEIKIASLSNMNYNFIHKIKLCTNENQVI